jgi:hypothetical protein
LHQVQILRILLRAGTQWHSRHHWTDQPGEKAIRLHEKQLLGNKRYRSISAGSIKRLLWI